MAGGSSAPLRELPFPLDAPAALTDHLKRHKDAVDRQRTERAAELQDWPVPDLQAASRVAADLRTLRHNVKYTYEAHFQRAKTLKEEVGMFKLLEHKSTMAGAGVLGTVGGGTTAFVLNTLKIVEFPQSPRIVLGLFAATGVSYLVSVFGFVLLQTQRLSAEADASHKWASAWHALYNEATKVRNDLAHMFGPGKTLGSSGVSSRIADVEVMKSILEEKSPPTDEASYQYVRKSLNEWYEASDDKDHHARFGSNPIQE